MAAAFILVECAPNATQPDPTVIDQPKGFYDFAAIGATWLSVPLLIALVLIAISLWMVAILSACCSFCTQGFVLMATACLFFAIGFLINVGLAKLLF